MKRSLNFKGRPGKHLTADNLVALMKKYGKSDEEIIDTVKDVLRKPEKAK